MIDEEGTQGAGRGSGACPGQAERGEKGAVMEGAPGKSAVTAVFRMAADRRRNDRAEGGEERFAGRAVRDTRDLPCHEASRLPAVRAEPVVRPQSPTT